MTHCSELLTQYCCLEWLHTLYIHAGNSSYHNTMDTLNTLDQEVTNYMRHAEEKCCTIKNGVMLYLPEAAIWLQYQKIYHHLLHCLQGWSYDCGNLQQSAWWYSIEYPFHLQEVDIKQCLQVCNNRCKYFWIHRA